MKWIEKITSAFRSGLDGVKSLGRRAASLLSFEAPETPPAAPPVELVETPIARPVAREILPISEPASAALIAPEPADVEVEPEPVVEPEVEVDPPPIEIPQPLPKVEVAPVQIVETVEPVVEPKIVAGPILARSSEKVIALERPVAAAGQPPDAEPPAEMQRLVVAGLTEVDASTILANGSNFQRVSRLQVVKAQLVCNWAGL